ncbi:PadR family transcriptional regulator [Paenibacillus hamazuiensis]|uniref:PadR family transcriptional regulator n=1 Tax=Paenibacillus hamazuiensis TaxID=2936508 RepID=UPI00200EFBA4|nr:PadR family transcriptional regulator [Paenibacillus hamazuiensis]
MYELFVLGQLMSGDKHGYLLQERLKHTVGPIRQISSGTLYPLLSRMAENGWITLRLEEEQQGGRPRKIYSITDAGRERFHVLILSPLEHNLDTELIFHLKMALFRYVPKDIQIACLEQYMEYVRYNLKYVNSLLQMFSKKHNDEHILIYVMRMLEHRKHVALADIAWLTEEIERIKSGGDPPDPQENGGKSR